MNILLTGKTGQVGHELQYTLAPLGNVVALDRSRMDLTHPDSIRSAVRMIAPRILVNAAAYTAVDKAESEADMAMQVNGVAPGILAEEAKRLNALFLHYSTDYVFDGRSSRPYTEDDGTNPLNAYGRSKLEGEAAIAAVDGDYLILRTSWVYSDRGSNFLLAILRLAREKKELAVVDDQIGSPTWARALAGSTAALLTRPGIRKHSGTYHLSATGSTSRFGLSERIVALSVEMSGNTTGWATLKPIVTAQYPLPAARPPTCITSKDKIKRVFDIEMSSWEEQLRRCLEEMHARSGAPRA